MDDVRLIPVSDIVEPRSLLRLVDRNSIEYLELRDSIAQFGFTSSISVRPSKDWTGKFEIIGGVTRYTIAKELDLPMMPCIIKLNVSDDELLILQLQENAQGIDTKPIEYARQIRTILTRQPDMDIAALSVRLKKSPAWIGKLLGLLKLPDEVQKSVNRGDMPLDSAYLLSKMPRRLMAECLHDAKTLSALKFRPIAAAATKRFQEAVAHGRLEEFYTREFTPHPYLRHLKEIQAEMAHHQAGPELVATLGCKNPIDGFYAACQWFIHLDPESIKVQRDAARARERKQLEEPLDDNLA
jgi:ParB/RepB/Spo0J family partition protein